MEKIFGILVWVGGMKRNVFRRICSEEIFRKRMDISLCKNRNEVTKSFECKRVKKGWKKWFKYYFGDFYDSLSIESRRKM